MQFLWELHEVMHMKLLTQSLPSDWYILSVIIIPSVVFLLKDHIIALLLLEYFAVFFFFLNDLKPLAGIMHLKVVVHSGVRPGFMASEMWLWE